LGSALLLLPLVWHQPVPTGPQLGVLFLFGAVQMALPYWMVARGLRVVGPAEAGTIMLLEPILNPVWVFFAVGEQPSAATLVGGAFIVGALAWRYWPRA
jgi:drug/metabolite transporter (DMT)-like permease